MNAIDRLDTTHYNVICSIQRDGYTLQKSPVGEGCRLIKSGMPIKSVRRATVEAMIDAGLLQRQHASGGTGADTVDVLIPTETAINRFEAERAALLGKTGVPACSNA